MTENVILSIVIPIYNGEKYLDRCVKAIVEEHRPEVELLLLDDGSQDDSWNCCKRWRSVYQWIRVFHHTNHGVSYTRNRGIQEAKGKYIWFVDVDDVIISGGITSVIENIHKERADIILFGYKSKLARKQLNEFDTNPPIQGQFIIREDIEGIFWELFCRNLIHNIGNKVYLREMLVRGQILFDERLAIYEDAMFCVKALQASESLSVYAQTWYCYNLEENMQSLNHIYRTNYFIGVLMLYENISGLLGKTDTVFYRKFLSSALDVIGNEFRRKGFCYADFKRFAQKVLSNDKVRYALEQVDEETLAKRWKRMRDGKYYGCFILFKAEYVKGRVMGSTMTGNLFDSVYCIYKRLKNLMLRQGRNDGN